MPVPKKLKLRNVLPDKGLNQVLWARDPRLDSSYQGNFPKRGMDVPPRLAGVRLQNMGRLPTASDQGIFPRKNATLVLRTLEYRYTSEFVESVSFQSRHVPKLHRYGRRGR